MNAIAGISLCRIVCLFFVCLYSTAPLEKVFLLTNSIQHEPTEAVGTRETFMAVKFGIPAILPQQFFVRPAFNGLPLLNHDHQVGVAYR